MRHPTPVIAFLTTSLLIAGCGGGSGGNPESTSTEPLTCGSPQWNVTSQTPFEAFTIQDIGEDALAALQDESQSAYILATQSNTDTLEGSGIIVPLSEIDATTGTVTSYVPTTKRIAYTGASMDLKLIAGEATCDGPTADIDPISKSLDPSATVTSLTDNYGELLLQKASIYGYTTLDELRTARDEFLNDTKRPSTGELPLLLALDAYETVKDILSGSGEKLSQEDLTFFASVMDHIGYPDGVEQRALNLKTFNSAEGITSQPNQPAFTVETTTVQALSQTSNTYSIVKGDQSGDTVQAQNSTCKAIRGDSISVDSAGQLSYFMRRQKELEDSFHGVSGASRAVITAATPALGVASGGAAAAVGGMLYVEATLKKLEIGTLPSDFEALTYELKPGKEIPEDYEQAGKQAEWNNAKVTVSSEGFDLTGPALDALSQVVGVGRWAKGLGANEGALGSIKGLAGDLIQNQVFDALKNITGETDCLKIPPEEWGDIDVTDRQWTKAEITTGSSLTLTDAGNNDRNLNLEELGVSAVAVEIKPDKFGNKTIREPAYIDVVTLKLIPEPGYLRVTNLGSTKTLKVSLRDSEAPEEPLLASQLSGGGAISSQPSYTGSASSGHQFDVATPALDENYPMVVQVERTSPLTGDVRSAQITLGTAADIDLTPESACLEAGETRTFTATVEGADSNTALNWTVDTGTLTEQAFSGTTGEAIYSPPAGGGGRATVQVSLASDSTANDTASIAYGECDSGLAMDGNYSAVARAPGGDQPDDSFSIEPPLPSEPTLPDTFWLDRTEQKTSILNVSGDDVSGLLNSSALFQAQSDGTATFELDMSGGSTQCAQKVLSGGSLGDVECSVVEAEADWNAKYYLEITEPVTYQFDFEMQCTQTGKGWVQAFMIPKMFRYVGGDKSNAIPPNGYPGGPVEPTTGSFINTNIDEAMPTSAIDPQDPNPVVGPPNVCKDTLNKVTVSKTMNFEGPASPGTPDIIVLDVLLEGAQVGIDNYNEQSTLRDIAVGPIVPDGNPPIGTNDGSADIRIRMSLREQ